MSMQSWTEFGYGIPLNSGDNIEAIKKFICENSSIEGLPPECRVPEDMKASIMKCDETFWIYVLLKVYTSSIVAAIINAREGTTLFRGYDAGEEPEQEEMIGVEPRYIWDLNEKDRTLTKEQITGILEKYAGMLGISAKPDFFNAEYYG